MNTPSLPAPGLAASARSWWFVMKTCVALFCPPADACLIGYRGAGPSPMTPVYLDPSFDGVLIVDDATLSFTLRRDELNYRVRVEPTGLTLRTTDLVHEAYLRLASQRSDRWKSRAHFLAIAAMAMRRILIDHARTHRSEKRGGGVPRVSLDAVDVRGPDGRRAGFNLLPAERRVRRAHVWLWINAGLVAAILLLLLLAMSRTLRGPRVVFNRCFRWTS